MATQAAIKNGISGSSPDAIEALEFDVSAAMTKVVSQMAAAESSKETVMSVLESVREHFNWTYGAYFRMNPIEKTLEFNRDTGYISQSFRQATSRANFTQGSGLSGEAWAANKLICYQDSNFPRSDSRYQSATSAGVRSAVVLPIFSEGQMKGTLEFYSTSESVIAPSVQRALGAICELLSSMCDDKDVRNRMCSVIETVPLNIMTCDLDLIVTYMNDSSYKTLLPLEHALPVKAKDVVGSCIDIFHKNPGHQRGLLANPSNLPHKAKIVWGEELLQLEISGINDKEGDYIGCAVSWAVLTEQEEMNEAVNTKSSELTEAGFRAKRSGL